MNLKTFSTLVIFFLTFTAYAQTDDQKAVQKVVQDAYIDGIQNNGSIEAIKNGFHPSFTMLRLLENNVSPYPIADWIAAIEKNKANPPATPRAKTEGKFIDVNVSGNAAVVKLELYREGKLTFTDYLSLYKFNEGWKIVTKIYHRH